MSNNGIKSFKKEKWLFFALALVAYFVPYIIVIACLFPMMHKADTGYKVALGVVLVIVNAIPLILGIFKSILAHYPMLYGLMFAGGICFLGAVFKFDIFAEYTSKFLWIEFTVALSALASFIFWIFHRKYARYSETVKAAKKSGAFQMRLQATGNPSEGSNASNNEGE